MRVGLSLVKAVVVLLGLATLAGFLDRIWWVFETADVFRLQYVVGLAAAALLALAVRQIRFGALAAALAFVNVTVLANPDAPNASGTPSGTPSGDLRLVVANVEVGNTDFEAVQELVAATSPDLVGLTELTPFMAQHLNESLPGYRERILETRTDAYGIGVYSRLPLISAKVVHFPASGPPTVVARVRVAHRPVTVVVTHVHTTFAGSIHVRQLHALADAARSHFGKRVIVCGDFNTPPWSGPLRAFAADGRLRDLYGRRAWAAYTWPTWSAVFRLPIDNCFVSQSVAVAAHRDGPGVGSDHRPLVVDIGVVT